MTEPTREPEVIARFIAKVRVAQNEGDCWEWTGSADANGRGRFFFEGKIRTAYRVAFTLFNGPIPDGMMVCHSCDNPSCVNPEHLWIGTGSDNMRDAVRKGRHNYAGKRVAVCKYGHYMLASGATVVSKTGTRRCVECKRRRDLASYHARRARGYTRSKAA